MEALLHSFLFFILIVAGLRGRKITVIVPKRGKLLMLLVKLELMKRSQLEQIKHGNSEKGDLENNTLTSINK